MAFVESYSVNGTSFDNERFAIDTVLQRTPTWKGGNLDPAMDHGSIWREKRYGTRSETWAMWVCDNDPSTGLPPASRAAQLAQYNANLDEVTQILMTTHTATGYDAPLQVVRKMKKTTASPTDEYRLNYGELIAPLEIEKDITGSYGTFMAEVGYLDPRWYECDSAGAKTNSTITATGNPGGTALMTRMSIELASGTANPYIENETTGSKLTYTGTPSSNLTIDTVNYTVKEGSTTVTGNLDRTGSTTTDWFQLRPGVSNTLTSNVSFTITYSKAYL